MAIFNLYAIINLQTVLVTRPRLLLIISRKLHISNLLWISWLWALLSRPFL